MLEGFTRTSEPDRLYRTSLMPVVARLLVRFAISRPSAVTWRTPAVRERAEASRRSPGRAVLAEAEGDVAAAAGIYRDAARDWRRYGMPIEVGQLLLGLARCERGVGRRDEARAAARTAAEVLEELRATPLLAEASALLGELEG
jgi:hypothetical protein